MALTIVKKEDWTILPLPDRTRTLPYERDFTEAEMELIRRGLLPNIMEDKWFIYMEDQVVHFHRSWTGTQIYQLPIVCAEARASTNEVIVNREPTQYKNQDDDFDINLLDFLIDRLLLGKTVDLPEI